MCGVFECKKCGETQATERRCKFTSQVTGIMLAVDPACLVGEPPPPNLVQPASAVPFIWLSCNGSDLQQLQLRNESSPGRFKLHKDLVQFLCQPPCPAYRWGPYGRPATAIVTFDELGHMKTELTTGLCYQVNAGAGSNAQPAGAATASVTVSHASLQLGDNNVIPCC